jgi:hypothetical protein
MPHLWGRDWTRRELEARVGHPSQMGGLTSLVHDGGSAHGMRIIQMDTGSGLVVWLHPDRCLDIPRAWFRGIPIGWRSPSGDVAPGNDPAGDVHLLRSLSGGLMFTAGLTNVGPVSEDAGGIPLPQHGVVHSLAAEELQVWTEWEGDDWVMRVRGRVTETRLMREHLSLTRTVTARLGEPRIHIEDTVRNDGFQPSPLMILHHINIGAPVVSEGAEIAVSTANVEEWKRGHADDKSWGRFPALQAGAPERVFFHAAAPDAEGWAEASVVNAETSAIGLHGVRVRWRSSEQPFFWQWMNAQLGECVLGLEPTNACAPGQRAALAAGQRVLEPGESAAFALEITPLPA